MQDLYVMYYLQCERKEINNMIDKFLEALDEGREYDFIANYYYQMSKEDLKNILIEYIYAVHRYDAGSIEEDIQEDVRSELQDSLIEW